MRKNNIIIGILICIVISQLIYKVYICYNKEDFFIDELYSYGLMNYKQAFIFEDEEFNNNWHNSEYFNDYLTISKDEALNWGAVYKNQVEDYHPPLYYFLLRIFASFSLESFTKWSGLMLNIIIFVCCDFVLYKIGNKIFKNKFYSLILVFGYGFTKFSTENVLFIRMYQLLELWLLMLTYWSIKNYNKKELKLKELITFEILVIFGTLTHYYFLIFLIPVVFINIIKYIKKKQILNIWKFILMLLITQIIINLIFPPYFEQLSRNYVRCEQGNEKQDDTSATKLLTRIGTRQISYLKFLNENMLGIKFIYVTLTIIVIGIVISIKKQRKHKFKYNKKLNMIIVPTIFYWLIVCTTSPYNEIRYVLPILVFIFIIMIYAIIQEINIIIKNKKISLILIIIICLLVIYPRNTEYKYQYRENKEMIEQIELYKHIPCIYMYRDGDVLNNDFVSALNYIRSFEDVYIMDNSKMFINKELEKVLKDKDISNGILIYDRVGDAEKRVEKILSSMEGFSNYKKILKFNCNRKVYDEVYWIY